MLVPVQPTSAYLSRAISTREQCKKSRHNISEKRVHLLLLSLSASLYNNPICLTLRKLLQLFHMRSITQEIVRLLLLLPYAVVLLPCLYPLPTTVAARDCSHQKLDRLVSAARIEHEAMHMRPRALVTGAAGFIGSHVAEYCATAIGLDVVGVDDLSGGFEANFEPTRRLGGRLVIGNVLDDKFMRHLFAKYGPFDYVYHLAAYAAEGLSHFIRRYNYENNLVASATVLNCALRQGEEGHRVRRFVFTSSIAAYGSTPVLPMIETTPKTPEDPYGIAKLAFEFDLVAAKRVFPELIDYTIFRPHNVYGPRQNLADKFRNAVAIFINQIMRHQPITIYGDGRQTRAFSYIDDVAPVIAASVLVDAAENEDFFVGTDNATSVNNLAALVARAMGTPDHQIVHLDARKEVVHAHASNAKMRCAFAPAPPVTLAEGLASTVQNFRAHGASEPTGYLSIEVASHLPPTWARWLAHVARRHHAAASCAGDCADDRCMGDHVIKAESDCPVPIVLNSRKPAVLFIVPGFGGMPARREVVAHNLELLQAQTIDLSCIVYVYNDEGASNARQNFKHVCDIVGPARGSWVDFASRVPKHSIRDSDFVAHSDKIHFFHCIYSIIYFDSLS